MESSNNFFERAFSKINGIKQYDLSTNIIVKNSPNTEVKNNKFEQSVTLIMDGFADKTEDHDADFAKKIGIDFESSTVHDKTDRAILNIDYIDKFIFACNQQNIIPTVRMYAFFSHISSTRCRSDMSEYNQLVLSEKDLFDKMIYLDFKIKLIISLEVGIILQKWYDNLDDIISRMTDLADRIDGIYGRKNVEIVIDDGNSLDGQFILHDCLFIHALSADPVQKYSFTQYETNLYVIHNAINVFDQRFAFLKATNKWTRSHFRIGTMSEFVRQTVDARIENISKIMELK